MDKERMQNLIKLRVLSVKLNEIEKELKNAAVYIAVTHDCVNEKKV